MQHLTFDDTVEYSAKKRPMIELFDWSVFLVAIMLVALGLISIYSATFDIKMSVYFTKQLQYAAVGITVMFALARTVGWVAQWNEMISTNTRIGRPRQWYTGPALRDYPK